MRKLLIVASLLVMSTASVAADGRHMYGHRNAPLPTPRPYMHKNHNILPWVAGGLALGALGGAYYYDRSFPRYRSDCYEDLIGYDRRGREIWRKYCN